MFTRAIMAVMAGCTLCFAVQCSQLLVLLLLRLNVHSLHSFNAGWPYAYVGCKSPEI